MKEGEAPAAKDRATEIQAVRNELVCRLQDAVAKQANYYNKSHKLVTFSVGQQVLLDTRNIRTRQAKKKLNDRFPGPFTVLEPVGRQSYRLELSSQYTGIHPVFHCSLLEPYQRRAGEEPPAPILIEDVEEWEVEKILDTRVNRGKTEYLVRWQGFAPAEDSWQPADNLHCPDKVAEYEESLIERAKKHRATGAVTLRKGKAKA